jgi:hypothetical protein
MRTMGDYAVCKNPRWRTFCRGVNVRILGAFPGVDFTPSGRQKDKRGIKQKGKKDEKERYRTPCLHEGIQIRSGSIGRKTGKAGKPNS